MKQLLIVSLLVLFCFHSSFAQEEAKFSKSLHFNYGIKYSPLASATLEYYGVIDPKDKTPEQYTWNFGVYQVGLALNSTKNNNYHYFNLMPLFVDSEQQMNQSEDTTVSIARDWNARMYSSHLSYEYYWGLVKKEEAKFVPYIGVSAGLFYQYSSLQPYSTVVYPVNVTNMGLSFFLVPTVRWNVNEKLFAQVSFPFNLIEAYYEHKFIGNPSIPENQRTVSSINFDEILGTFNARLGIGVNL